MKHYSIIVSALLAALGAALPAQGRDYLAYYPGDEAAWLEPLAEGTVDSGRTVSTAVMTVACPPAPAGSAAKESGEQRAVCEFEVP